MRLSLMTVFLLAVFAGALAGADLTAAAPDSLWLVVDTTNQKGQIINHFTSKPGWMWQKRATGQYVQIGDSLYPVYDDSVLVLAGVSAGARDSTGKRISFDSFMQTKSAHIQIIAVVDTIPATGSFLRQRVKLQAGKVDWSAALDH